MIACLYLPMKNSAIDTSFHPWQYVFGTNLLNKLDKMRECPAYVGIIQRIV